MSYIVEGSGPSAQPLHPFPIEGGTEEERRVFEAATNAARRMISAAQIDRAVGSLRTRAIFLCPVLSYIGGAELVGIARPVHRPNTSRTRAWVANFLRRCDEHVEVFKDLGQSRDQAMA